MPKIANKNKGTTGSREVPIIINFLVTLWDKSKFGKTSFSGNSKSRTNSGFLKSFLGRYLFVFVKYLRNHSPKIKTKYCILIYATVDFRHWLDDSIDSTRLIAHTYQSTTFKRVCLCGEQLGAQPITRWDQCLSCRGYAVDASPHWDVVLPHQMKTSWTFRQKSGRYFQ